MRHGGFGAELGIVARTDTVELTANWYRNFAVSPDRAAQITASQIEQYRKPARVHVDR
jgi:hypothetical protein